MEGKGKGKVGVAVAAAVGLGAIIGAGIFVLSGTAIALSGTYALVAFAIVGVLAFIIALELGELGSLMPYVKGASYSYTYKAFGSELGFITGMLRYMALSTSIGAIALGFGSYLASFAGISIAVYAIPFAIVLIFVLSIVNMFGVKKAAEMDFVLVAIKIGVLIVFIAFALFLALNSPQLGLSNLSFGVPSGGAIGGIFAASIAVFFAYSGFQSISTITDRINGGARGYVKAILTAVTISVALYLLVVLAMLIMMPPSAYKIAADPLATALKSVNAPSWLFVIVDIGALVATASATIAMILSSSRSLYQMSMDRLLPRFFRKYNAKTDTAENGIIISAIIGVMILFAGNIYIIAAISNFGLMFDYMIIGFDVIHFRRRNVKAPFAMPLYPYLPIASVILLLVMFTGMPQEALAIGVVLIMLLLVVYYSLREIREKKVIRIRLFE
ncbi:MAG: amino acid permease [Candidatus Micrarchaeota archaeon]|nr:amino acid permease [Candidatus Micrarchaeota archaeon]